MANLTLMRTFLTVRLPLSRSLSSLTSKRFQHQGQNDLTSGDDIKPVSTDALTQAKEPIPPPLIINRDIQYKDMVNPSVKPMREAWVENFDSPFPIKLGIVPLHPAVWAATPRIDKVQTNIRWQSRWRKMNWLHLMNRWEMDQCQRKPWPQKGTGRARHGSITSPLWKDGGWHRGPRGHTTQYHLLHHHERVQGLAVTFTTKFAQNDVKIVDSLENFPSDDPEYLEKFVEDRAWGPSVLISDVKDVFPRNIALAAEGLNHINLMPVYGLNCFSMLKHETLVLTLEALEEIEKKMLYQLNRTDFKNIYTNYRNLACEPIESVNYEDYIKN